MGAVGGVAAVVVYGVFCFWFVEDGVGHAAAPAPAVGPAAVAPVGAVAASAVGGAEVAAVFSSGGLEWKAYVAAEGGQGLLGCQGQGLQSFFFASLGLVGA